MGPGKPDPASFYYDRILHDADIANEAV